MQLDALCLPAVLDSIIDSVETVHINDPESPLLASFANLAITWLDLSAKGISSTDITAELDPQFNRLLDQYFGQDNEHFMSHYGCDPHLRR